MIRLGLNPLSEASLLESTFNSSLGTVNSALPQLRHNRLGSGASGLFFHEHAEAAGVGQSLVLPVRFQGVSAMAQSVGVQIFLDTRSLCSFPTRVPNCFCIDGPITAVVAGARK